MRAVGGAVAVVDVLLSGEAPAAFSAGRPPGHHALRARAGGFCLFNNIAVAAIHALGAHALTRVLIFDWDVHHGNGTNDLFTPARRCCTSRSTSRRCTPAAGPRATAAAARGRASH